MPDRTIRMMSVAAMLSLVAFGVMSCQKKGSPARTEAAKSTEANSPAGLEEEKYDSTLLAMQGAKLSVAKVKRLEEKLQANPDDLVSRVMVLGWYSQNRFSSESARAARYKHILWFIKNHPDAQTAGAPEVELDPVLDKEVYGTAKDLWLEQTEAHKTNATVLGNAARFFFIHDSDMAEELFKKAQALEPDNPEWSEELGHLYGLGLAHESAETKRKRAARHWNNSSSHRPQRSLTRRNSISLWTLPGWHLRLGT